MRLDLYQECKHVFFEPDKGDNGEIRILILVIVWTSEGFTYEADRRHAEIVGSAL